MNILKKILLPVAICAVVLLNLVGCGTKGKKSEKQTTEHGVFRLLMLCLSILLKREEIYLLKNFLITKI